MKYLLPFFIGLVSLFCFSCSESEEAWDLPDGPLLPTDGEISGTIVDQMGNAVEGIEVSAIIKYDTFGNYIYHSIANESSDSIGFYKILFSISPIYKKELTIECYDPQGRFYRTKKSFVYSEEIKEVNFVLGDLEYSVP